ncbi:unnamed protein product [Blepharisma stoltei]|uniref:Uncharacterized protein n=1 Tax=Blepharisma stoltei TaxID=1481888 RepID=A0AAU9JBG5_9CILI|nr:unnamed protein product [Blepharisma stoltei]
MSDFQNRFTESQLSRFSDYKTIEEAEDSVMHSRELISKSRELSRKNSIAKFIKDSQSSPLKYSSSMRNFNVPKLDFDSTPPQAPLESPKFRVPVDFQDQNKAQELSPEKFSQEMRSLSQEIKKTDRCVEEFEEKIMRLRLENEQLTRERDEKHLESKSLYQEYEILKSKYDFIAKQKEVISKQVDLANDFRNELILKSSGSMSLKSLSSKEKQFSSEIEGLYAKCNKIENENSLMKRSLKLNSKDLKSTGYSSAIDEIKSQLSQTAKVCAVLKKKLKRIVVSPKSREILTEGSSRKKLKKKQPLPFTSPENKRKCFHCEMCCHHGKNKK